MLPFDVVTVPDFSGQAAPRFEMLTLLFLAAWLDNGAHTHQHPLHLACIGTPPPRVRALATRAKATITCFAPLGEGLSATANKLRGLEIPTVHPQRLLLDIDVFVLGDLSALATLGACLAAAPAGHPRLPLHDWQAVYAALAQPLPAARMACVQYEVGLPGHDLLYAGQGAEFGAMLPYYNSGVLWVPTPSDLQVIWRAVLQRTATLFPSHSVAWQATARSDQVGLALAIQQMQASGTPFRRLPDTFHGRWLHLYGRTVPLRQMRLFHAVDLGRTGSQTPPSMLALIEAYQQRLRRAILGLSQRLPWPQRLFIHRRLPGWLYDIWRIGRYLRHLEATYLT